MPWLQARCEHDHGTGANDSVLTESLPAGETIGHDHRGGLFEHGMVERTLGMAVAARASLPCQSALG